MLFLIIVCFSAYLQSCKKDTVIVPEIINPIEEGVGKKVEIVWEEFLGITDSNIYLSSGPILVDNKVVIGRRGDGREKLAFRDKKSGKLAFVWDEWNRQSFFSNNRLRVLENRFVFGNSETQSYLINSMDGRTIWYSEVNHGSPRSNIVWNKIYHSFGDKTIFYNNHFYLTEFKRFSGIRDTIFVIDKVNSYEMEMEPPAGWINGKGDSLLIFLNRSIDFGGTLDEQLDAYAYNITADSVEWKLIDFDPEGSSKTGPPLIEDDLVYFAGERTFYCLNAKDGTTVWKRRFDDDTSSGTEDLFTAAFIKVDNNLIVNSSNRNAYCFDAYTGVEIWKETDSASSPQNMIHHNGIIYCASRGRGKLFAFDVETGEHFWREHSPNHEKDSRALFTTNIAIDHELGYLYTTDRFFIMCIKLIER